VDGKDTVLCYDEEGEKLWEQTLGAGRPGKHRASTGSNPSPVTDGKRVYVYFNSGALAALDLEGVQVWSVNLQERYGPSTLNFDIGTSPVLVPGGLAIAVMHSGTSYLVAFDRSSGEILWRSPRSFDSPGESNDAYTTPAVLVRGNEQALL
jgi:outer membrane protein assembly factor BamB